MTSYFSLLLSYTYKRAKARTVCLSILNGRAPYNLHYAGCIWALIQCLSNRIARLYYIEHQHKSTFAYFAYCKIIRWQGFSG